MSSLKWTSKSVAHLKHTLQQMGHEVADTTIRRLLRARCYSLRAHKKNIEGISHLDRVAQFEHINEKCKTFEQQGNPIISIDCKKKELLGNAQEQWSTMASQRRIQRSERL